jgi:proteic killer suppression protein
MIVSFGDEATADLFHGRRTSRVRRLPQNVSRRAINKLDVINAATQLVDLRSPPGNRLEALRGDWQGYHSIRVNNQWRIVFQWANGEAHDVALIDYH